MRFSIAEQDSHPKLQYRVTSTDGEIVRFFDTLQEANVWIERYGQLYTATRAGRERSTMSEKMTTDNSTDQLAAWADLILPPAQGGWYAVLRREGNGPWLPGADEWRGNKWRDGYAIVRRSPQPFNREQDAIVWAHRHAPRP